MKRSEFYDKIINLPLNCETLDYYEALFKVVEFYQDAQPDWELIVRVLHRAALVADGEKLPHKINTTNSENEPDVKSLLRFLKAKIDYLKENGVPKMFMKARISVMTIQFLIGTLE